MVHHTAGLIYGFLGFAVCHAENAVVRVVLQVEQAIKIVCKSIAMWDDLPDQIDGLFVVLAPGPSPKLVTAGSVGSGNPGEDGKSRCYSG